MEGSRQEGQGGVTLASGAKVSNLNYGLSDRVVVVSGGTSGIGLATATAAARDGAHVAVLGTNAAHLDSAMAQLRAAGGDQAKVFGALADVRDRSALDEAAANVAKHLGPVFGIVAAAGIAGAAQAEQMTLDELNNVFAVNVGGVLSTVQAFGPGMIERRSGSIVLIGSINSFGGQAARMHYTASKHAVLGMVRNLAIEWGRHGVRVNGIAPGPVDTPMLRRNVPPSYFSSVFKDRIPLGRLARADEIASATLMLLGDAGSFVNGAMLVVDGGMTAGPFTRRQGADLGSRRLLDGGVYEEE
jgi:NAD(P)-dependent dehydrogenase (short-subunit alcohol dehydrogenase family)